MSRYFLLPLLLVAFEGWAQDPGLGLDLSDDPKKEEAPKTDPKPAPPPTSSPPAKDDAAAKAPANTGPAVERDITQDDRVKSVQKKLYLKRYRFEIAPYFTIAVNDPYFNKLGGALRLAFYLSDTLALSIRGSYFKVAATEDEKIAKRVFYSRVFGSVPIWNAMGNFEWSPFYGKVAFMNTILHLDGYLAAGAGMVWAETSANSGPKVAFDFGGGLRFVVRDWVAVNAALINTTYVDAPSGTTKASTQNMLMSYIGLSIFIPFKSTYREAE